MCDRAGVQQRRAVQLNYKKLLQGMESTVDLIIYMANIFVNCKLMISDYKISLKCFPVNFDFPNRALQVKHSVITAGIN